MDKMTWLTYAFTLVWFGLGCYLVALGLRLRNLEQRLGRVEQLEK
jgi:CcmD family protein